MVRTVDFLDDVLRESESLTTFYFPNGRVWCVEVGIDVIVRSQITHVVNLLHAVFRETGHHRPLDAQLFDLLNVPELAAVDVHRAHQAIDGGSRLLLLGQGLQQPPLFRVRAVALGQGDITTLV
ncbi:MAG TPA: hypothetical protein P5026_10510 [Kiritimatiellia bacterium]|nr:hypothetical protein [Kiritimatiellia bacterium]